MNGAMIAEHNVVSAPWRSGAVAQIYEYSRSCNTFPKTSLEPP